jgi:hypothetical protein
MTMSKDLLVLKVMREKKWSRRFATEYVMERTYNGLSHSQAFQAAMRSKYIKEQDKPKTFN